MTPEPALAARRLINDWAGESLRLAEAMNDLDRRVATALQDAFAAGYALGAAAHVEHHTCRRCFEAGAICATAPTPNP